MITTTLGIAIPLCLAVYLWVYRKQTHPPAKKSGTRKKGDTVDVGAIKGSNNKVHITHDYGASGHLTPREEMLKAFVEDFRQSIRLLTEEKLDLMAQLKELRAENKELRAALSLLPKTDESHFPKLLVKKIAISVS